MAISVNCSLLVGTILFLLSICTIAVTFGAIAASSLQRSGFEVGIGELHSALELLLNRVSAVEQSVDNIGTEVEISSLWSENGGSMYNSSSSEGVLAFFNATLLSSWTSEIFHQKESGMPLGYGLICLFDTDHSLDTSAPDGGYEGFQFPQVWFDILLSGEKDYIYATRVERPATDTSSSVTIAPWNFRIEERPAEEGSNNNNSRLVIEGKPYANYVANKTFQAQRTFKSDAAVSTKYWEDSTLWVSGDGHLYQFMTYIGKSIKLPNPSTGSLDSSISPIGFLPTTDALTSLQLRSHGMKGTIFLSDGKDRVITTSNTEYNLKLREQILSPGTLNRRVDNGVLTSELGVNFPVEELRQVFSAVRESLHLLPTMVVDKSVERANGVRYYITKTVAVSYPDPVGIELFLVWYASEADLLGDLQRDQFLIGSIVLAISFVLAILLITASYQMVASPLVRLTKKMNALSSFNMDLLECLEAEERGSDDREQQHDEMHHSNISEVQSLHQCYAHLKETLILCLPYVPQIEGDLRIGTNEREMAQAMMSTTAHSSALNESRLSSIVNSAVGSPEDSGLNPLDGPHQDQFSSSGKNSESVSRGENQPIGLFAVMATSINPSLNNQLMASISAKKGARGGGGGGSGGGFFRAGPSQSESLSCRNSALSSISTNASLPQSSHRSVGGASTNSGSSPRIPARGQVHPTTGPVILSSSFHPPPHRSFTNAQLNSVSTSTATSSAANTTTPGNSINPATGRRDPIQPSRTSPAKKGGTIQPEQLTVLSASGSSGLSSAKSGSTSSNTILSVKSSLNKEMLASDNCVVAHFRLRPDIMWGSGSAPTDSFKEASFLLHYHVTQCASEQKGSVFSLGAHSVSCVWTPPVAQGENKAVAAATSALTNLLPALAPFFPQALGKEPITTPFVTVGIVRGPALVGTIGSLLKRTYTCEGPAVHRATIYSHVAHQIRTHILTDSRIEAEAKMFAELRPVDVLRIPRFRSAHSHYEGSIETVHECIGYRGSATISATVGDAKSRVSSGSSAEKNKSSSSQNNNLSGEDHHQDLEWMYQLEANQKAEAKRLTYATKSFDALKAGDLEFYRAALKEWISNGFMENDLFLTNRRKVFQIEDDLQDADCASYGSGAGGGGDNPLSGGGPGGEGDIGLEPSMTMNPQYAAALAPVASTSSVVSTSALAAGGGSGKCLAQLQAYFRSLNAQGKPYCREATVLQGLALPFEVDEEYQISGTNQSL